MERVNLTSTQNRGSPSLPGGRGADTLSAVRGAHHRSPRAYERSDPHRPLRGSWVPNTANSDPIEPFGGSLGREHQTWGFPHMFGHRSPLKGSPTSHKSPTKGSPACVGDKQSPTTSDEKVAFGVAGGNTDSGFRSTATIPMGSRPRHNGSLVLLSLKRSL